MAPPDYANFGTFTDTEFRDIFHRRQHQIVPTGNVIQKLHTHYDTANSAPILSSVQASSMDATNTQGEWNLLLRSATNPLSGESITTANTAAWTANAIITATPSLTTLRSANVRVTSSLTVSGDGRVNGNVRLGDTMVVRQDTAYVGISTVDPKYSLDVNGDINSQGLIRILGNAVMSMVSLGNTVNSSNLTSVGTLTGLTVSGGTVSEGLQVGGVTKLGQTIHRTFERTIPSDKNTVDICTVGDASGQGGTFMVEFTVVQSITEYSFADKYIVPVRRLSTGGEFVWLTPISTTGEFGGARLRIQLKCEGSGALVSKFRLARAAGFTGEYSGITVSMTLSQDFGSQLTITPTTTTSTDEPPGILYSGTAMITNGKTGSVGINVFEPNANYMLDVNGAVKALNLTVTDTAVVGNLQVLGSVNFGRNITKSFDKILLGAVGSTADICDIDTYNGTATIQLSVVAAGGLAKLYHFAISNDQDTGGVYQRLMPVSANDHRAISVEIKSTGALGADTRFRLVRTDTYGTESRFTCHFTVYYNTDQTFNFITLTTVEAGVTPSTTIFKATALAQVNGKVGINTDNPSTTLDVVGEAKVSGNVTSGNLRVLGTGNVFALRATTMNVSGASSVNGLTATTIATQSLNVAGNLGVGYMKRRELIVTGITQGGVDFCEIYSEKGSFLMEMTLVQSKTDNQTAKYYKFPVTNHATVGAWKTLLPLIDEGMGPNDFFIQIRVTTDVTGTFARLRILSFPGTNKDNSDIVVSLTTHGTPFTIGNDILITQLNILSVDVDINVQNYSGTMMSISKNIVGINTLLSENPADNPNNYKLVVAGNVMIDDTLRINGATKTGNATVFTQAENTAINFSDKMRFYYNAEFDALEIQRKIGGTWTKTATLAV